MRFVDSRLIRHGGATTTFLGLGILVGLVRVALLIAQAVLLADIITRAVTEARLDPIATFLLSLVFAARAVLSWTAELVAHHASSAVGSHLRLALLGRIAHQHAVWGAPESTSRMSTTAIRGIEALDRYVARYLPLLAMTAFTPVAVCLYLAVTDRASAVIVATTAAVLAVVLGISIARARRTQARQWETLQALAHHFLDMLSGLGTLAAFGRARAQVHAIGRMAEIQRKARQLTLRAATVANLWLELLAAVSLTAVNVLLALRLVDGTLDLAHALVVLLLAPEAYRQLCAFGRTRQATMPGVGAAEKVLDILDAQATPPVASGGDTFVDARAAPIRFDEVTVLGVDRAQPLLYKLSLEIPPGRFTGIVGPSGAGKSTVLALIAGLVRPDHGRVLVGDVDLSDVDLMSWRLQLGWLSQEVMLFTGTVADNIALARFADDDAIRSAAAAAAVDVPLDLELGEGGRGLSAGQRRRVALARALVGDPAALLLDEPTGSVDPETEAAVFDAMRHTLAGRTVVVVTYRPALLALCHHVVRLDPIAEKATVRQDVPT